MKHIRLNSTKRMALATAAILVVSSACVPQWRLAQPSPPAGATSPSANSGQGAGAGMGAQEYEVDGRIELRLFRPDDRSLSEDCQGSFRVYVKGCAWLIQVTEMNEVGGIPQRREVGTSDGKEMFEMVVPYEPISSSDPVVFVQKAMPPGVHIEPEGTVASNAIPVGEQDSSFTGHLWLMFASGFYFRTATSGGQLTPVFDWHATPYMNNHATMKATWELINANTPGSLPSKVTFFEDNGTPEAVYEATGFTNVGALTLPNGFHFTEPGTGYKEVTAVVTAVRPICSRADLRPALKQETTMIDMRWYDEKDGSEWPGYEADHWPTVAQAKRIYSSTHPTGMAALFRAPLRFLRRIFSSTPPVAGAGMSEPAATPGDGTSAQAPAASNAPSVTNGAAPIASVGSDTPFATAIVDHPGVKLPEQGPWTFSDKDFLHPLDFTMDLVDHKDPMFLFLWDLLPSETKSAMEKERARIIPNSPYTPGPGIKDLAAGLNHVIEGKIVYDETVFAPIKRYLSGDTVKLLNEREGVDSARLNRLLLEDAFLLDFNRRPKLLFEPARKAYFFVDFAAKTISRFGTDGEKKWTADMGPSIADESSDFPYHRIEHIPVSDSNVGLWDVPPGSLWVKVIGNAFYRIDYGTGVVVRMTRKDGTSAQARAASNAPSVTNGAASIASVGPDTPFASAILEHPGVKLPEQGPWTVSTADFMQMAPLIGDLVAHNDHLLEDHDPMFIFLWNSLSSETKSALEAERAKMGILGVPYKPGTGPQVLVANLNKLIQGKLIYDEPSFAMLKPFLSGDTVKLLNQPAGADVSRLNRLLLEDAFPLDILRRPKILFDAAASNYYFIDFAKKTVSLYGKDGKKKWTADLGPSIADESERFPYFRNPGIPASGSNVGLWDVSCDLSRSPGRTDMILVHIFGNAFSSVDVRNGKVTRLAHP